MSEELYDEKIAPVLAQLGQLCKDHSLPFLAVVEYAPGEFGRTLVSTPEQSMPMVMANIAAQCRGNLDSLVMSVLRYCRDRGIDTSASIYANAFKRRTSSVGNGARDGGGEK